MPMAITQSGADDYTKDEKNAENNLPVLFIWKLHINL